jgi:hypothetical protein
MTEISSDLKPGADLDSNVLPALTNLVESTGHSSIQRSTAAEFQFLSRRRGMRGGRGNMINLAVELEPFFLSVIFSFSFCGNYLSSMVFSQCKMFHCHAITYAYFIL